MGVTKNTYWLLPNDEGSFYSLADAEAKASDGAGLTLTGYEKIFTVSTTGSVSFMGQHNPTVSGDFWVDFLAAVKTQSAETKTYRFASDIIGDVRCILTNTSGSTSKVKVMLYKYTVHDTYITIPQYRSLTNITYATISDEVLAYYIDLSHMDVIRFLPDKTSSDDKWREIQQAESLLATHYAVINGWDVAPIEETKVNEISSQWKEQYRELIIKLSGQDPFKSSMESTTGDGGNAIDGVFESKIETITSDEDSYILSTTR